MTAVERCGSQTGEDTHKDTQYTAYIGPGPIYCVYRPCGPELAQGHRVSRPRGTGSVGDR